MPAIVDDLSTLKDDMIAFVEGHGMRRFHGFVDLEIVPRVPFKSEDNPDGWKDFVEHAKASGVAFLTMDAWTLQRDELDEIIQQVGGADFTSEEDVEDAQWLRTYLGKTGFVQLGFAYNGIMFVYEAATEWYERYQNLLEFTEDFGGIPIDPTQEDER